MENNVSNDSPRLGDAAVRVFAVLGFVAVIIFGMWGSVRVAEAVPGAFSSLAAAFVSLTSIFVPAGETVTLSGPQTVAAGTPFTISWTHEKQNGTGSYTFRYDCADGVYFTSPDASGKQANVYCNTTFNFINTANAITLTPVLTKNGPVAVTMYVDYTPNGSVTPTVTGKGVLSVTGSAGATTPVTTPTTPTTPVATTPGTPTSHVYPISGPGIHPSDPNGYVDLVATVLQVGVVDKNSGAFFASSSPSRSAVSANGQYRIAVQFQIQNNGTKTSPQFNFNAVLPTMPSNIFASPMQQALAPGDRIEFTLGFDELDPSGTGVFTVNADPSNSINEPNKTNNIAHYTVTTTP